MRGPMSCTGVSRAMRLLLAFAAVLAALLLAGCSEEPPVISRVMGRVVYVDDVKTGQRTETLSVYLIASDPNGMEDLSAFYVIDDADELFWKVDRSAWVTSTAEGETWVGSSALVMPRSAPFPAGAYRVVLQSVNGDTVEDTIAIPVRSRGPAEASYPSASVAGETITIRGAPAGCEVWAYAKDGTFAGSFPVAGGSPRLSVAAVRSSSPSLAGGFSFRVYSWDPQGGYGVLAGPWPAGG